MKYQHLNDVPEFRAAQERLVELQLQHTAAEKKRDGIQEQIGLYDELQAPTSGSMQRTAGGKFGPPPDRKNLVLQGNSVDAVTEKARHLTTAPQEITVGERVSREKLVEALNEARAEILVLAKAIELQRGLVEKALCAASSLILEGAAPEYRKLVRAFLDELLRMEQVESAMRDYWTRFSDGGCVGIDHHLPQMPRTGIGRRAEPGSRFNNIFNEAEEHALVAARKGA